MLRRTKPVNTTYLKVKADLRPLHEEFLACKTREEVDTVRAKAQALYEEVSSLVCEVGSYYYFQADLLKTYIQQTKDCQPDMIAWAIGF